MNTHFEIINYFRGFSIFTIVLMHLLQGNRWIPSIMDKALSFGGAGVHVFILVSGFGLYLSHLRNPLIYTRFLKKRFTKVYTPYAILVVAWFLWFGFSQHDWKVEELLSHLLLYKMFSSELDVSLCHPYWFISTIIQFYLAWPILVRLARLNGEKIQNIGMIISLIISLIWATIVGFLGYEDLRPWGSNCIQYLWEFVLGMWLAEKYYDSPQIFKVRDFNGWILLLIAAICMGVTGIMAWNGGFLNLYNDIPSLMGYLSVALLIYKLNIKTLNSFFSYTNSIGYEWYLLHSLIFTIVLAYLYITPSRWLELILCFVIPYLIAILYHLFFLNRNQSKKTPNLSSY